MFTKWYAKLYFSNLVLKQKFSKSAQNWWWICDPARTEKNYNFYTFFLNIYIFFLYNLSTSWQHNHSNITALWFEGLEGIAPNWALVIPRNLSSSVILESFFQSTFFFYINKIVKFNKLLFVNCYYQIVVPSVVCRLLLVGRRFFRQSIFHFFPIFLRNCKSKFGWN